MVISSKSELCTMKRSARNFAILILALVVGASVFLAVRRPDDLVGGVRAAYYPTGVLFYGDALLRKVTPNGGDLLIGFVAVADLYAARRNPDKFDPTGPIYRFDGDATQVVNSSSAAWRQAHGTVSVSSNACLEGSEPIRHDVQGYTTWFNQSKIQTAGPNTLRVSVSPDCEFVAVISAGGRRRAGFFFFGGGFPNGPYYLEMYRRVTGMKTGPTFILDAPGDRVPTLYPCWEEGGEYLVLHDGEGRHLWVVPGPNHQSNSSRSSPEAAGDKPTEEDTDE